MSLGTEDSLPEPALVMIIEPERVMKPLTGSCQMKDTVILQSKTVADCMEWVVPLQRLRHVCRRHR
ncbi:hypothetical protein COCON_G00083490 [Conger conger]|uniref:Uncharacterized protein n=1 Tax=Conger conger TaxID=82655 RepID=A0A9Q1DQ13_CONCO|nr:hypothetical protein COCON_G00083490 [Conger conger]